MPKLSGYPDLLARLKARRQQLGLSQLELDRRIGWASGYTATVECGTRRLSLQAASEYAQAVGLTVEITLIQRARRGRTKSALLPHT